MPGIPEIPFDEGDPITACGFSTEESPFRLRIEITGMIHRITDQPIDDITLTMDQQSGTSYLYIGRIFSPLRIISQSLLYEWLLIEYTYIAYSHQTLGLIFQAAVNPQCQLAGIYPIETQHRGFGIPLSKAGIATVAIF